MSRESDTRYIIDCCCYAIFNGFEEIVESERFHQLLRKYAGNLSPERFELIKVRLVGDFQDLAKDWIYVDYQGPDHDFHRREFVARKWYNRLEANAELLEEMLELYDDVPDADL